jgi:hypothetical protein
VQVLSQRPRGAHPSLTQNALAHAIARGDSVAILGKKKAAQGAAFSI